MTSFKCRECDNHWNEGPTRDHRTDQLCRECHLHKLKVVHADAERGLMTDDPAGMRASLRASLYTTAEALGLHSEG